MQEDIVLLKKEIDGAKEAQKKQIDDLRKGVKNDVKEQITKSTRYVPPTLCWPAADKYLCDS